MSLLCLGYFNCVERRVWVNVTLLMRGARDVTQKTIAIAVR